MKMIALRDFLHPHDGIKVRGEQFELEDENLVEYCVGMGYLEYATIMPEGVLAEAAKTSEASTVANADTLAPAKSK